MFSFFLGCCIELVVSDFWLAGSLFHSISVKLSPLLSLRPSLTVHLGLAPFFSLRPSHSVSPSVSLLIRLSRSFSLHQSRLVTAGKGSVHAAACGGPAPVRSPATPPAPAAAKAVRPAAPPPPPPAERKPRPAPIECALPLLADALGGIDSGAGPAVAGAVLPQGARQRGPRRRRCEHGVAGAVSLSRRQSLLSLRRCPPFGPPPEKGTVK